LKPAKLTAWTLMAAMALLWTAPMALAAPVESQMSCAATAAADSQALSVERDLINARLMDFGLSEEAAADRVALLTDEEIHALAADLNAIQTAGITSTDRWDTTTVLLVLILVVLIVD